ncbi:flagellar biosynthesis regulator FlaF [Pseudoroseomonas globiformis]|uniref:Flagellar biosynthesis regulator FlaF n=1 Tax=Teichococcus globiformis TaxID=2307229 RepID=A0ABV7G7D4_9PROT
MTTHPALQATVQGLRAAEAGAFRRALTLLEMARADGRPMARAEAVMVTGLLWDAVLASAAGPNSLLPAELREGLASLARSVLEEVGRPKPDLDFLILVNGEILAGLATYH